MSARCSDYAEHQRAMLTVAGVVDGHVGVTVLYFVCVEPAAVTF